jgi:hypothetical protein
MRMAIRGTIRRGEVRETIVRKSDRFVVEA